MSAVSVIIPVYNTEKYLRRCLDSVLAQTFAGFELILVDDGSTDSSGSVCDEYAAKDERIVVFHQENKGQAAARNVALDYVFAKGGSEWIAFIDSDDWVDSRYLEILLNHAKESKCEISACGYAEVNDGTDKGKAAACPETGCTQLSPEDYYAGMNMLSVVPWAKLFATHLWSGVRFPEGIIHEDEFVMYKILFTQPVISFDSAPLYHYYVNNEGTMRKKWTPARLSGVDAKEEQIRYMAEHGFHKAFERAVISFAEVAAWQIGLISDTGEFAREKKKLRKRLQRHLRQYRKTGLFPLRSSKRLYYTAYPFLGVLAGWKNRVRSALVFRMQKPRVMSSRQTAEYILKHKCSVARYGDGEYRLMRWKKDIGFQPGSKELSERLYDVLRNPPPELLVCVPDVFDSLRKFNQRSRLFWQHFDRKEFAKELYKIHKKKYRYGNAQFTRIYIEYGDDRYVAELLPLIKKNWDGRDILLVEGAQTRFGVGNDLLDNAGSVVRILAPAVNAFSKYDEILSAIRQEAEDRLILLALGPTATVLACELCRLGFWAIDIGHLDIEYEWYRMGAKEKVAVPGKYTNEAGGVDVVECDDAGYKNQIIRRIE